MNTPSLSHIRSEEYDHVYEPSEDSFLMLDALEKDLYLLKATKPLFIVEIGSGSGVTITGLAEALPARDIFCFATDINLKACELTQRTADANNVNVEVIRMDLLRNFRLNMFDVIIFNPPYVVTESSEIVGNGIERSWAGGAKGREITDRLLSYVRDMLAENGLFYLVTIEENEPNDICEIMKSNNFECTLVIERKVRGEHLKVFRFSLDQSILSNIN